MNTDTANQAKSELADLFNWPGRGPSFAPDELAEQVWTWLYASGLAGAERQWDENPAQVTPDQALLLGIANLLESEGAFECPFPERSL